MALCVILFSKRYWQELREYFLTLVMLVIVGVVCLEAREIWTKGRRIKDDLFLATSAIIITILIFVLQNLQAMHDINNALQSTTEYNCMTAKELKEEITKTKEMRSVSPRISRRYTTDLYKDNIGYLLSKFDKKQSQIVYSAISNMDEANRFLDLSLANFSEFPTNSLNSDGNKIIVNFEAHVNIGKIYDNEVLGLSQNALDGLKIINSRLGNASFECVEH